LPFLPDQSSASMAAIVPVISWKAWSCERQGASQLAAGSSRCSSSLYRRLILQKTGDVLEIEYEPDAVQLVGHSKLGDPIDPFCQAKCSSSCQPTISKAGAILGYDTFRSASRVAVALLLQSHADNDTFGPHEMHAMCGSDLALDKGR